MKLSDINLKEFHWLMGIIESVDVGLVVIDKDYHVKVWNTFMVNHSNLSAKSVQSKNLFGLFPDTDLNWIRKKIDTALQLNNRAFSTWEQRPYLFHFSNYHPITGSQTFMYQNISIIPLTSVDDQIDHVCLIIYDVTDIACQRKELAVVNSQLEDLSRTDALTTLNNRGYWEQCLQHEYNRFQRDKLPISLVIFDIDHFKNVNDTYGHQVGDEVIKAVARQLKSNQRSTDISGRYGGEEFVIILHNVGERSARIFSERLRLAIQRMVISYDETDLKVTVSLGVAELTEDCKNTEQWLGKADQALYNAKGSGRNKSVLFGTL